MMRKMMIGLIALCGASDLMADWFGTEGNQFELTFQNISSGLNPSSGAGQVGYAYGIGTHEITADQWGKYLIHSGGPIGGNLAPTTSGSQAVNNASWYEAAQFVNWLNTSSGYQAAYSFDESGNMGLWSDTEKSAASAFRHKDTVYVLPSEDEWVKAAYWNGTELQAYSTPGDTLIGMNANYDNLGGSVWDVGTGTEEINGTFDMMGNVWEWNESAFDGSDNSATNRVIRGGAYFTDETFLSSSSFPYSGDPANEVNSIGFRVAAVPEPAVITMVGLAGIGMLIVKRVFAL